MRQQIERKGDSDYPSELFEAFGAFFSPFDPESPLDFAGFDSLPESFAESELFSPVLFSPEPFLA